MLLRRCHAAQHRYAAVVRVVSVGSVGVVRGFFFGDCLLLGLHCLLVTVCCWGLLLFRKLMLFRMFVLLELLLFRWFRSVSNLSECSAEAQLPLSDLPVLLLLLVW